MYLGIEHEYEVSRHGQAVDFRNLVHHLALGQHHLDPGDPYAYRLDSGAVLTCDKDELEIALPPVPVAPGFAAVASSHAAATRAKVASILPAGSSMRGYSTHLSVSTPDCINRRVARLYTETFAPALMLLLDRRDSPGLLVRPRPSRTELGGEFAAGTTLRAVAEFAVGSIRACQAAVAGDRSARAALPPRLSVDLRMDERRFGWFVGRDAFGPDLYADGREAGLRRLDGGAVSAQEHLELAWQAARGMLEVASGPDDLSVVDRLVAGDLPLPSESDGGDLDAIQRDPVRSTYGEVLGPKSRPGFDLAPVMATWDLTVFVVLDTARSRQAFACVPSPERDRFLAGLARGDLDRVINDYLRRRPRGRRLHRLGQTRSFALFDELGPRARLLPRERPLGTGWLRGLRPGTVPATNRRRF